VSVILIAVDFGVIPKPTVKVWMGEGITMSSIFYRTFICYAYFLPIIYGREIFIAGKSYLYVMDYSYFIYFCKY
jgi:hypothetical protein